MIIIRNNYLILQVYNKYSLVFFFFKYKYEIITQNKFLRYVRYLNITFIKYISAITF